MRLFLLVPDALGKLEGKLFSPLASVRLRCLEIAPHLAKLGHRPRLVIDREVPAMVRDGSFWEADAYINFKTTYNLEAYLAEAVARDKPVLFDICDNVFVGEDAAANEALLSVATLATTPTVALGDLARARGAVAAEIPDCIEGDGSDAPPGGLAGTVRLLWFGRRQNAEPLMASLADLASPTGLSRHLTVVCDDAALLAAEIGKAVPDLSVEAVEWSPTALASALSQCHIALTPMSDDAKHVTKSANRLAHALHHNRPVATQPFGSLDWLAPYVTVAQNLGDAVESIIGNWPDTLARTERGMRAVRERLHPETVAHTWDEALAMAAERVSQQPKAARRRTGVRLNLGCGDKLLPYYINIDAMPERGGTKPDMVLDVRDLSAFEDNSVDEVLSVHLIEHLPRWDAPAAVAEWVRVLKPGGALIIECPNLLAACEAITTQPEAAMQHDGELAQRTMWALYGDPGGRDALMMHQWGYTAESLGHLLRQAGLENVRSEPPRFKLGAPRDLRIAGTKPGP
jgi:predicted SAM-dependent methyltransferase